MKEKNERKKCFKKLAGIIRKIKAFMGCEMFQDSD